jgi:5-methylcytosine-specific restriction endonuclease McrA
VPKPKRSFCSDACVHEWKVRTDPNYARDCVLSRDNGICAKCGRDTIAWWHELQLELRQAGFGIAPEICAARAAVYRRHGLSARGPGQRVSLWDVDHITPVSEGGGECGLEGLRTLCVICHRNETDALTARRYRESRPLLGDMEQAS